MATFAQRPHFGGPIGGRYRTSLTALVFLIVATEAFFSRENVNKIDFRSTQQQFDLSPGGSSSGNKIGVIASHQVKIHNFNFLGKAFFSNHII